MRLSMKFCIKEFPRQFLSKQKIAILNSTLLEKNEKERKKSNMDYSLMPYFNFGLTHMNLIH